MLRRVTAAATALVLGVGALVAIPAAAADAVGVVAVDTTRTQAQSTGDVILAWKPVAGATTYTVQIASEREFGSASIVDSVTTPSLQWVPQTGLWAPTARDLFWRVSATTSFVDAPVHAFRRAAAPAPKGLQPDAVEVGYPEPVVFSWEPVPGAVGYAVSYGLQGEIVTAPPTRVTSTSFSPAAPLSPGTYAWSVRAVFPLGSGTFDSAPTEGLVNVTWDDLASTPVLEHPANGATANDLEFQWKPVPGAMRYMVEVSADSAFTAIELQGDVTGTTFVPTTPLPSQTYWWRVTAFTPTNIAGVRTDAWRVRKIMGANAESTAKTTDTTTVPTITTGSPDAELAPVLDANTFELTWNPVPRATYYYVSINRNGKAAVTCQTASTSVSVIVDYIAAGNATTAHKYADSCLWTTNGEEQLKPMAPGTTPTSADLYMATVTAVNVDARTSTSYQGLHYESPGVVPTTTSPESFFYLGASTEALTEKVVPKTPDVTTDSVSPTLAWSPVTGASGYIVSVYGDEMKSTLIGRFYTRQTKLTSNGVFARNDAGDTDRYVAEIQPADATKNSVSDWTRLVGTAGEITWQRNGDAPAAGTVDDQSGTQVLHMTPTSAAALGGSNRGYQVDIFKPGSKIPTTTLRVDQPFTAAIKSYTYDTKTKAVTTTALPAGEYEFTYAILDAAGQAGPASPSTPFSIGAESVSGLTVTAGANGTSATLRWTADTASKSFNVFMSSSGNPTKIATLSGTALTVADLEPGVQYSWYVVSTDKDNNSNLASPPHRFTLPKRAMTSVTPSGAILQPLSLRLAWNAVPGASRYVVRLAPVSSSLASAKTYETSALSFAPVTALAFGTDYHWDVRAVSEKTTTSSSRPVLAHYEGGRISVVTTPAQIAPPRATATGTTAQLTWSQLSGVARGADETLSYVVEHRPSGRAGWSTQTIKDGAAVTLSGLAQKTTYEFRVSALNSVGQGPWSRTVTATTATKPEVVRDLAATAQLGAARLTWRSPASDGGSPITSYVVRYRLGSGPWSSKAVSSTSITLAGLRGQQQYEVHVAAVNAVGTGQVAGTRVVPLDLPGAARSVSAKRGDGHATVMWAPPSSTGGSAVTGYVVEVRSYASGRWTGWTSKSSVSATTRSYKATGLENGTRYEFRVIARTRLGSSTASGAASVTPAGKPLASTKVKAKATKKKRNIKVTWKSAASNGSKVTKYVVQYSTNGKKWKTLKSVSAKSKSFTWKKAKSKKPYYFRVYAKNALGSGAKSVRVSAKAR